MQSFLLLHLFFFPLKLKMVPDLDKALLPEIQETSGHNKAFKEHKQECLKKET